MVKHGCYSTSFIIAVCHHVVVVGPRYIDEDFTVRYVSRLEHDASGVVGKCNTNPNMFHTSDTTLPLGNECFLKNVGCFAKPLSTIT